MMIRLKMKIANICRTFLICACLFFPATKTCADRPVVVRKWGRFEQDFKSKMIYENPLQDARLAVVFTGPSGESTRVNAFWDGGKTWRVRFSPGEVGKWIYSTACSDVKNLGLDAQSGSFLVTATAGRTRFDRHGPVTISHDGHYLIHEDGTPFFWLADTAWNSVLLGSPSDLVLYTDQRVRQKFTAVQWVATQWRAAPHGDADNRLAFEGWEKIRINPQFFQRMDQRIDAFDRAGLLSAPVLLWAIGGGSNPSVNPGFALPEQQAILLARYMVARWGAHNVFWILAGDGDYRGANSEKWKRIGRAVFGDLPHAPVTLHPGGMQWILNDFKNETWYDVAGYQSGHGDDEKTLGWLASGPPATEWNEGAARPFINLETPYEGHLAYQSKKPITPEMVRRAIYWSLLVSPTAGVTYGGHGVWGWDNGKAPPVDHPYTGTPLPWQDALRMPGAEQMAHVATLFNSMPFWRLRPAPEILARQPGNESAARFIAAASTVEGDFEVIYVPEDRRVELRRAALPSEFHPWWFNPRDGSRSQVGPVGGVADLMPRKESEVVKTFFTPSEGDWVLVLEAKAK